MARQFTAANSEYFEVPSTPITALPFSIFCKFNLESTGALVIAGGVGANFAGGDRVTLEVNASDAATVRVGATAATSSLTLSSTTWYSVLGRGDSGGTIECTVDGANSGTNTGATFPTVVRTRIGARPGGSAANHFDGLIAEFAMWNVLLTDAEDASLAADASPAFIRPNALVYYDRMIRGRLSTGGDSFDIVGGLTLTDNNTVTVGAHPPGMFYPGRHHIITAPSGVPAITYTFRSGIRLFTAANWSPDRAIVFEASIRATAGTARARLFDVTAAAAVANSEVTTTSSSMTRLRSAAITLVDGNEYRMQTGKAVGSTGFYLAGHNLWT